jgi:hypothetical protein
LRKVYQDKFGHGEGNCAWACVASIFDLDIEAVRYPAGPSLDDLRLWTKNHYPALTLHGRDLGFNYRIVRGGYKRVPRVGTGRWTYDIPVTWTAPTPGYWLASIFSLKLKRPIEDPYYPMPNLHMVVMKGRELVHDPHPSYAELVPYQPTVVMQTWWTA